MNKKIAIIVPSFKAKSETWIWRQVNYLKPNISFIGIRQTVPSNTDSLPLFNLYKSPSLIFRLLKRMRGEKYNQKTLLTHNILKIQKKNHTDIYYIHFLTQAYLLSNFLLKTDKDIFIHCHGYDVTWDMKKRDYPFENVYTDDYFRFIQEIKNKVIFIANSQKTFNDLLKVGVSENRIKILYFGVNKENEKSLSKIDEKVVKILYLGRLVDAKAPHKTILAFEKAVDMGLNAELTIAGNGNLMTTCRILINNSKYKERIKLLGEVSFEEGRMLREQSHIFTAHNMKGELTNQIEAYGVSYLEAMSAGLPVVTGRSGGIIETVIDGKTGLLFTPGDIDAHAKLLYKLGTNKKLRDELSKNAVKHVRTHFTMEKEEMSLREILRNEYEIS